MLIMVPWGYAHWEEYHDGTMLYGNGVWGITEALYALIILHFVTCWVCKLLSKPPSIAWPRLVLLKCQRTFICFSFPVTACLLCSSG